MELKQSDYLTTDELTEVLRAHTDADPIVDLKFLVVNRDYIEKGHNFTIKFVQKKGGRVLEAGVKYVRIRNDRDKYTLREEIKEAYRRNTGLNLNLDERPTREITSIVDPKTNPKGNPILDTSNDPMYMPNKDTRI